MPRFHSHADAQKDSKKELLDEGTKCMSLVEEKE